MRSANEAGDLAREHRRVRAGVRDFSYDLSAALREQAQLKSQPIG
jgi:hypothetical protein